MKILTNPEVSNSEFLGNLENFGNFEVLENHKVDNLDKLWNFEIWKSRKAIRQNL